MRLSGRAVEQRRPALRPFAALDDRLTGTAVCQRLCFNANVVIEFALRVEHAGVDIVGELLRQRPVAFCLLRLAEKGRHLRQIVVVAVHIAGLIDRFLQQRIAEQIAAFIPVFSKFHRPVAAFAAVGDVFIQLIFIDKAEDRRVVAPRLPGGGHLCRDLQAVVIALRRHLLVGFQAGKRPFFIALFHGKQHRAIGGVVRFIAGRTVLRHAVAVVVAVAQPPVMVGHQLRVHFRQPGFIFRDVIDFHHRPGRQARFGISLVPVAAVAAALRAQVPGDQIRNEPGILRPHFIVGGNLPGEDGADVLFRDLRVEVGHGVGLLPGIPRPGLVAGEPAPGYRRRDGVVLNGAARRAPVAVKGFDRFHRHPGLLRRGIRIGQPLLQIAVPARLGSAQIVRRSRQNIADLRFLKAHLLGVQQVRIGGIERGRAVDLRAAGESMAIDLGDRRQGAMDLILRFAGGH